MLIAVISDTHGIEHAMRAVKRMITSVDVIIHLGDNINDLEFIKEGFNGKVYGVSGNCDYSSKFPVEQVIELQGKKFFITHGHNYGVKYDIDRIFYRGKELGVDVVLFGHSHRKLVNKEEGMWLVNPGSTSLPKDKSASIAFIEINNDNINIYTKDI